MIPVLLILVPLLAGMASFFLKNDKAVRSWALATSVVTLVVSVLGLTVMRSTDNLQFSCEWIQTIGSRFSVKLDGMGQLLCLLNAVAYPLVILATWNSPYKKPNNFFALMLLAQAGMMGVFLATDALLFYFFWELALIPMYFLCSQWGGNRRIPVTFKFFIYTFIGSLLMLIGILYVYANTPDHSFSMESFYRIPLSTKEQYLVFFLMFIAFAIKMPVWPLHTWQPDTYEQAPTATTMILSGVMVKMGLFGLLRWLFPVVPYASWNYGDFITPLALAGVIYASLIAIRQNDLKRLVAYSSIAHIGLMCAAAFSQNISGLQGLMIQMFNHGINIIGLWIVVELIERKTGTRKISELGGLAQKAPVLAILLVIVALANIALPLTNAFPGEFLMFNGIFSSDSKYNILFIVMAGMGIILGAVYTLNMIRKVFYGDTNELTVKVQDISWNEKWVLFVIVGIIFFLGIYPQCMLNETAPFIGPIVEKINAVKHFFNK
ncbi:MAG TPA: NADH-quinone oxidoreductase subunit M [Chitinophagaceae bacterium]|jgi:NADH-quinone oxidoreductase subunit M|nr:NADH-quinone oxidoreductase subunit M [Chitinophagaceae bacterium]